MFEFTFTVRGTPRSKGSFRPITIKRKGGGTRAIMIPANKKSQTWENAIAAAAAEACPHQFMSQPIALTMTFHMARAKGHYGTGRNAGKLKDSAPQYVTKKPRPVPLLSVRNCCGLILMTSS